MPPPLAANPKLDSPAARREPAAGRPDQRPVAVWLLVCCALVFAMVLLGGLTRLTHSGLSMVDWRPLTGWLPPLSEAEWQAAFRAYQQYPEYQQLNRGMTLEGFQSIFWLEYVHRLWGRLIGLVFAVPLLYFWVTGRLRGGLWPRLLGIFTLGAMQGVLGWYMVRSGLVDRPDVSQYRLAAHLGLAVAIYGAMLWVALGLLHPRHRDTVSTPLARASGGLVALVLVTTLSGGFVAGLDAGLAYNTFPLMGEHLVPPGMLALEPPLANLFENIVTVQFTHRVLALATLVAACVLWWRAVRHPAARPARHAFHLLLAAALVQAALGVSTLLLMVPVALAAAHQAGALLLFTAALYARHALARAHGAGAG